MAIMEAPERLVDRGTPPRERYLAGIAAAVALAE